MAAALLAGVSMAAAQNAVPNRLLIKPKANASELALKSLWASCNMSEHHQLARQGVRVMTVSSSRRDAVLQLLRSHANIEYVELDYIATPCLTPNDTYYSQQWHLPNIQAPGAWNLTTGGTNIILAIVDSGVDLTHPDLSGRFLSGTNLVSSTTNPTDDNGHGTAVTGTAAATGNNGVGVAGVNWNCLILPVKVADASGSATYSALAQGIVFAADRGARVINISLGGSASSSTLQSAIDYAWSKGVVIVAAAGNNGNSQPNYPGACNHVLAVSALQANDTLASWSSYGSFVSLAAPGVSILTCNTNKAYASWSGTSFSSPIVAGVATLVASANPALSNTQIVSILESTAASLGTNTSYYGYGLVNASNAVTSARSGKPSTDVTAPTVAITSPSSGSKLTGSVKIQVSASDNVGVVKTEGYVDGSLIGSSTSSAPTFTWNSASVADGTHALLACAYDAAGNVGVSTTVSVTTRNGVDNTAPLVAITSPGTGSAVQGTIGIVVSASDDSGVVWVDCYLDGRSIGKHSGSSATFYFDTTQVANGTHVLQAHACDAGGNLGSSSTVSLTVQNMADKTAPAVAITSPVSGTNVQGRISVAITATDSVRVTRVECYLDNQLIFISPGGTRFYLDTTYVVDGTHTLQARAYDPAGNVGISANVSILVKNITGGPTVTITSPADGSTVGTRQSVTVAASETGRRITEIDIYVDGWLWQYTSLWRGSSQASATFVLDTRSLAGGLHTLEAVAWDERGQTGASPVVTVQK